MNDNNNNKAILALLNAECRILWRKHLLFTILATLLILFLFLVFVGFFDHYWSLMEGTAFRFACIWLGLSVLGSLIARKLYRKKRLKAQDLALYIEKSHPDFMDSLLCSVELSEQEDNRQKIENSSLRSTLIATVRKKLHENKKNIHETLQKHSIPIALLLSMLIGCGIMFIMVYRLPLLSKAYSHWKDIYNAESSGLVVMPGDSKIAAGENLSVELDIRRGPKDPMITFFSGNKIRSYPMFIDGKNRYRFEYNYVDTPLEYQIKTSTLRSKRYHVKTYQKPIIESINITIHPPDYTGEKPRTFKKLQDISVPKGSSLSFQIKSNIPVSATFVPKEGKPLPFTRLLTLENSYQIGLEIDQSYHYTITLDDNKGHTNIGQAQMIQLIEDLSPVILQLSPEDNAPRKKADKVNFSFQVEDDYGISRIHLYYAISGGEWQQISLYDPTPGQPKQKIQLINSMFSLDGQVREGDVISYYCLALDNAEPTPNRSNTPIQFIEIRPDPTFAENQQGAGMQHKALDIADLIAEQKALIQQSFSLRYEKDTQNRHHQIQDLAKAAGDLLVATRKRYHEIKAIGEGESLSPEIMNFVHKLFEDAIDNMNISKSILQGGQTAADSITFQQTALSDLISIEISLKKIKGKGDPQSQGQEAKTQEDNQEVNRDKQAKERRESLRKVLRTLNALIQRQEQLNAQLAQLPNQTTQEFIAKQQQSLQNETQKLTRELRKISGHIPDVSLVTQSLNEAIRNMQSVHKRLEEAVLPNAQKYGKRAEHFLRYSRDQLQKLQHSIELRQLEALTTQLEQLQKQQSALRRDTEERASGSTDQKDTQQLASRQVSIQETTKSIKDKLEQFADALAEKKARVSKTVQQGLNELQEKNLLGKMKRAENALRYQRLDRSVQYQRQAESIMAQLAKQLEEAKTQLSTFPLSKEQLTFMLQKTLTQMKALEEAEKKQKLSQTINEHYQAIQDHLEHLAKTLASPEMKALHRSLKKAQGMTSSKQAIVLSEILEKTASLIEKQLLKQQLLEQLHFTQKNGHHAPIQYEQLVKEYFKRLSKTVPPNNN